MRLVFLKKQTQSTRLWMASFVVDISLFTDARRLAKSIILSLQKFIGFRRWVSIAL
jgi:hypothetical protein